LFIDAGPPISASNHDMGPDTVAASVTKDDPWFDWMVRGRNGDSATHEARVRQRTLSFADRVLDATALGSGSTLIDVGAGDGLVAFRAIERVGPSLRVVLCDISADLLARAQSIARERGVHRQCSFVQCSAHDLAGIDEGCADALVTRSALAYVEDKPAAFKSFHRVLKAGGIVSMAEPIFRDDAIQTMAL
jgi:arsenite methyltransferase